jgi:hypothetical protein
MRTTRMNRLFTQQMHHAAMLSPPPPGFNQTSMLASADVTSWHRRCDLWTRPDPDTGDHLFMISTMSCPKTVNASTQISNLGTCVIRQMRWVL